MLKPRRMDLQRPSSLGARQNLLVLVAILLGVIISSSNALVLEKRVDPPNKLPKNATPKDLQYQPAMDFDTNGCYNVAAVDAQGNVAVGLEPTSQTTDCRDLKDLQNSNAYSRQRCNSGWCAYVYTYYFEKDYGDGKLIGHKHDWEHVVVWVRDVPVSGITNRWACASQHGQFECRREEDLRWDGDHPKIVYHKNGDFGTHSMRFANPSDDAIENHTGKWYFSDLVSYNGFPPGIREKLYAGFPGKDIAIGPTFENNLDKAGPKACEDGICVEIIDFDVSKDENGSPGTPPPPPAPPTARVKFMVAGDSISHGMENDWTWRWRLFAWLEAQGHRTDFVGPFGGTAGPTPLSAARPQPPPYPGQSNPSPASIIGLYAKGVADTFLSSGHASWWGRQAAQTKGTIQEWVRNDQPAYLLLMLGFNDLGWGVSDADGLLKSMRELVDEARKGKSDIKILIGNVIHRTFLREDLVQNTDKYNANLRAAIGSWSKPESLVRLVDVQGHYDCNRNACPDGYDGLHPNSRGEYHIAQAYAKVLKAEFGFGGADFPTAINPEPRTLSIPTGVVAASEPEGIHMVWQMSYNARSYDMRSRLRGQADWAEGPVIPSTNALYKTDVTEGQIWEFQVRSSGDNNEKSGWSSIVSATAHPKTAPAPVNIVATSRPNGIQVTWNAVTGYDVERYAVLLWDMDTPGYPAVYGNAGTSFVMDGLPVQHQFLVSVSTWIRLPNGPAGGPSSSTYATVGGSTRPPPPRNVEVFEYNALDIQLGWPAAPGAQGYHIYRRPITSDNSAAFTRIQTTVYYTTTKVADLFPGVWMYEFCIASYYGALESDHSTACVRPPIWPGFAPLAPKKLEIYEYDATTVQLGWASAPGAEGYYVYRRPISVTDDKSVFTQIASTNAPWTTIKIENLFPGVWHYEFCIASFAKGLESDHSTACNKPRLLSGWPPAPPSKLEIYEYDATTVQLGWAASNGAEGYYIYRRPISVTQDKSVFTRVGSLGAPWTTMKVENLFPGVWHYEFCISAYAGGLESDHYVACAKPKLLPGWAPAPPSNVEVFEFDAVRVQLGWPASNGAEGYYVYTRYIPDNGGFTKSPAIPTYTTTGIGFLFPGAWHFEFCISAYVGGLESDHSTACVIPPVYPGNTRKRELPASTTGNSTVGSFSRHVIFYSEDPSSLALPHNVTLPPGDTEIIIPVNKSVHPHPEHPPIPNT